MTRPLTIREIMSIGLPVGRSKAVLAMLKLFIDDTGTHQDSAVVGVGGLIGNEAQWEKFNSDWQAILDAPMDGKPPLRKWHSYDARWGEGEFQGYNQAERDLITRRFRDVITGSGVCSFANMIDGAAWNEFLAPLGPELIATPEATALFALIDSAHKWASIQPDGPEIAVYYDSGRMNDKEVQNLSALLNDPALAYGKVLGVTFLPVLGNNPLQGADMLATEAYWYAKETIKKGPQAVPRAHFAAYLRENFERGNGMIMERESIIRRQLRLATGSPDFVSTSRQS